MQERDGNNQALVEAHRALNEEFQKSAREVADLTQQIDRLTVQHVAAEAARLELIQQQSATAEAQVQSANEKAALEETAAELRGELMEACEREAQYVAQLRAADEWRQKYEKAARSETDLKNYLADMEARFAGKQQAHDETAKLVDEHEQKIAEYEGQLATASQSIAELQQELAQAVDARHNVELSLDLWESERAGWKQQQAAFEEQIAQLEVRLDEALTVQPAPSKVAPVEIPMTDRSTDFGVGYGTTFEAPTACDWSTGGDATNSLVTDWNVSDSEEANPTAFPSADPAEGSYDWNPPALQENLSAEAPENQFGEVAPYPESTEKEFSWGVPATRNEATTERQSADEPAAPPQSTSFIERYSHLFTDDKPANDAAPAPLAAPPVCLTDRGELPPKQGLAGVNPATSVTNDDEESIEQYMAKLLQRVRGDDAPAPSAAAKPSTPAQPQISGPLGYELPAAGSAMTFTAIAPALTEMPRRKSSMPEPQTDLEALRALANESARRAISRHSLRKYRRNAVTKMIVSMLAATTSLWLMLESPGWLHWQFLSACGTMLIAAYWAGETMRAFIESFRAAAPDETEQEIREISAELEARLPIDVAGSS
jgi:hypothetical protein